MLAFNNKIKIIKAYVPDKVKLYIESNLSKELIYFQKKYAYKIEILEKAQFIIPEYKIELLNKSKKIINKIEHVSQIRYLNSRNRKISKIQIIDKKNQKSLIKKTKMKRRYQKKRKKPRTLWIRKKKLAN